MEHPVEIPFKSKCTRCDLRFLMNLVEQRVRQNDSWIEEHTLESANEMFRSRECSCETHPTQRTSEMADVRPQISSHSSTVVR
jgi:hypothetical protein